MLYVHARLRMQKHVTDAMKSTVNTPKGQVTNLLVSSGTTERSREETNRTSQQLETIMMGNLL